MIFIFYLLWHLFKLFSFDSSRDFAFSSHHMSFFSEQKDAISRLILAFWAFIQIRILDLKDLNRSRIFQKSSENILHFAEILHW
jgi:hypothetical protein